MPTNPMKQLGRCRFLFSIAILVARCRLVFLLLLFASTGFCSSSTDYFESKGSGNWNDKNTWKSSVNGISWVNSTLAPTSSAKGITIKAGHTVTLKAFTFPTAKLLTVESGAVLKDEVASVFIFGYVSSGLTIVGDGTAAPDFIINGSYIINGAQPTLTNATVEVNGTVRVDNNQLSGFFGTYDESDDFAYGNTNVTFNDGAIFQWNTTAAFETSGVTYFSNSPAGVTPVFSVSQTVAGAGSSSSTTFNGKFEVSSGKTVTFQNAGVKTFRDGIGGAGTVSHSNNCGMFSISGTDAVIDGTVTLNLDHNNAATDELEIASSATVTISGSPTINVGTSGAQASSLLINGTLINNGSNPVDLTYGSLTLNGSISGTGTLKGDPSNTVVTVGGNGDGGTLTFSGTSTIVKGFVLQKNAASGKINLGSDLTTQSLTLTKGILTTGDHKFIYDHSKSSYSAPSSPYDSWICTCNSDGSAVSITTPFDGAKGFKLINVQQNRDAWFPVGADLSSPNRLYLKNTDATTDSYTVVVGKGDVINTPLPRVNRIWYIKNTSATPKATMRLYFTKRDWTGYPTAEDEVESGFLYTDVHLVQETYQDQFVNNANNSDIKSFIVADGTEIYGQYTTGVSSDLFGGTNGINQFTRFSVVNAEGIVLPFTMRDFLIYRAREGIRAEWSSLNELDIDHYELERSADAVHFNTIATIRAENKGDDISYSKIDPSPVPGKNYYRVKAISKNDATTYTGTRLLTADAAQHSLTVYPNPVQNRSLHMKVAGLTAGKYSFLLYDSRGREVFEGNIDYDGLSLSTLILPDRIGIGTYFIRMYNSKYDAHAVFIIE